MKILLTLAMVLSFNLTIWADMGVYDEKEGRWVQSPNLGKNVGQKEPDPKGTCMSGILLSIGIFLLGERLIRKNLSVPQVPKYSA